MLNVYILNTLACVYLYFCCDEIMFVDVVVEYKYVYSLYRNFCIWSLLVV